MTVARFRTKPNNTPVECRHCGERTIESMAKTAAAFDECPEANEHEFQRVGE